MSSTEASPKQEPASPARELSPDIVSASSEIKVNPNATKQEESMGQKNFAQKLFALLEFKEYQDVFHWLPNGEAFCVVDQDAFEERVMSKYFPSAKFQRCESRVLCSLS